MNEKDADRNIFDDQIYEQQKRRPRRLTPEDVLATDKSGRHKWRWTDANGEK